MRTIFYIGWFVFMIITSPFAFIKMKMEQYFCNHKDLMYKGKSAVCVHFGKIVLSMIFLLTISITGFCQIKVTPIEKTNPVFTNPSLSDLKTIKATSKDSLFLNRVMNGKTFNQVDSSEIYVNGDSVFIVHYFYVSDSTHPYRVNGGYIGKKSDFSSIMNGKDKLKFKNR